MKAFITFKRKFQLMRLLRQPWSFMRSMRIAKLSFLIHYTANR